MSVIDPEKIAEILKETAALHIMPRFQKLEDHEISAKTSPRDLVTEADIQTEAHLERILPDLLPGSRVIGEESVSRGETTLDILQRDDEKVWIIDPVDGTFNFAHGKSEFGLMLACVINGQTEHAWVYHVVDEKMHVAERGSGAYMNGTRLRVEPQNDISKFVAHVNYKFFPEEIRPQIKTVMKNFAQSYSIGSAAHEYTRIATGQSDLIVYSRLKPWDHLPGALIVEEAGGYIAKWDRNPYTPKDDYAGLIVTTSRENWEQAYELFFEGVDLSKYL